MAEDNSDAFGKDISQTIVKAEARSQHPAQRQEVEASSGIAIMNRILQVIPRIPMDRLRLMMADNSINTAEAKAALRQAGLTDAEIDANIEFARQVLASYAQHAIPSEQRLKNGMEIQQAVEAQRALIKNGLVKPVIDTVKALAHRISEKGGVITPAVEKKQEEGRTLL